MAHKLIEAVKKLREAVKCDHELIPVPNSAEPSGFHRTLCKKCGMSFYQQITHKEG